MVAYDQITQEIRPVHCRVQIPPKPQLPDGKLGQAISLKCFLNVCHKVQSRKVKILVENIRFKTCTLMAPPCPYESKKSLSVVGLSLDKIGCEV